MINKKKILANLKSDLREAKRVTEDIISYVSEMRNTYEGIVISEESKGSNYVSRDAFKQIEWVKSQLKNPFISNDTIVRFAESKANSGAFSKQTEEAINFFYTKEFNRYNFTTDMINVLLIEGTVIVRTGWEYSGEVVERIEQILSIDGQLVDEVTVEEEVAIVNRPTASVVRPEDVFIDPTAYESSDIQFLIHKREVRLSGLRKSGLYKKEDLDYIEKSIDESDDNNIYMAQYSRDTTSDDYANLEDTARRKMFMYEYWGEYDIDGSGITKPIVCSWVGDRVIRLEENPFPDKKIPYIVAPCIKQPFSIYGKSYVELVKNQQEVMTGMMRGIFDDIAQSNNRQIGVQKGNLDSVNFKRKEQGKDFEFNISPNAFYQGQYNRIPAEVFKVVQDVQADIQSTTGVVPFQGGGGTQAIYGSQASKAGQTNSMMLRELDMVINIADNIIKPMIRHWVSYIYDLLDPSDIEAITGYTFVEPLNEKDPSFYRDFIIDISTQHTDDVKASELAFLLQTLGNSIPFEMTQLLMSEIARLKGMKELSEATKNYKPQSDPYEQQMKQISLQKAQLELQLLGREADVDIALKQAKAKESDAKADSINQSSVQTKYGVSFNQKIQELNTKHQLELDKIREQKRLKSSGVIPNNMGIKQRLQEPATESETL